MEDFIRGEMFQSLSDNEKVFYRHTHDVNELFKNPPSKPFILVSHNSDGCVSVSPGPFDADFRMAPSNMKKWFGQNVDVVDEKIVSLPLGMENVQWFNNTKINRMKQLLASKKQHRNTLFVCHNINTFPEHRREPYNLFPKMNWATVLSGQNGSNFDRYIENIYHHKFVLCPRGNGIDTHRLWECLYLNTIPIVMDCVNIRQYQNLPILVVNNWNELTIDKLNIVYQDYNNREWKKEKLTFSYWKNEIQKTKEIL